MPGRLRADSSLTAGSRGAPALPAPLTSPAVPVLGNHTSSYPPWSRLPSTMKNSSQVAQRVAVGPGHRRLPAPLRKGPTSRPSAHCATRPLKTRAETFCPPSTLHHRAPRGGTATARALGSISGITLLFDREHNELCTSQTALRPRHQAAGPLSRTKPLAATAPRTHRAVLGFCSQAGKKTSQRGDRGPFSKQAFPKH